MALMSLDEARRHLRIEADDDNLDLSRKIDQASAIVLHYIQRDDADWDEDTDPSTDVTFAIAQAAALKVLANLYADRGDETQNRGPLTGDVVRLLSLIRYPSLA